MTMVITEGEGTIIGDDLVMKENGKKEVRVYVHFWPKTGTRAHALEMDPATFKALYELRMQQPLPGSVLTVKRGSVVFDGEMTTPPDELTLVDLKVIARIRTMAEGTVFEEKALGFIRDSDGDTSYLMQIAETLAGKLAESQTTAAASAT
jgi:hypothetical protein